MDGQVPAGVVQERYDRLAALVEETTYAENRKLTGATVEVLVAEGEGRKDAATHRMSGRARDNRLVHFAPHTPGLQTRRRKPRLRKPRPANPAPHPGAPRPGDIVTVTVTRAAPHYLLSDAPPLSLRRTRAGDAWEAAAAAPAPAAPAPAAPPRRGSRRSSSACPRVTRPTKKRSRTATRTKSCSPASSGRHPITSPTGGKPYDHETLGQGGHR